MENFDKSEIEKFSSLADQWWDPSGKFKPLHLINPLRADYISSKVNLKNKKILDVGCGGGILAESLALKGGNVKGIDLADGPLEVAKIREQKRNLGITYEKIETSKLIKKKEKFDVITCLEMLEHVPDPEKTVKECSELLNNNGDIFFSTINRNLKAFTLAILGAEYILNILPKGTHDYEKLIKPSELLTYIDKSGLEFSEIKGMTYIPFFDIVKLSNDPSVNYIIHARKK
ncbi:MAG: bifunctional 2-polyprenyl-6-hydroxyphenol methylase/3-demethylubiquinol 3-O-methyltransferase UbiG [Pseudomonadota bacterium]|nr:bifunctional 2-polyprenyl-6-hydroxyphenol methylase/3-demethylubiquinol 3-O-methyltransferase UbiG [Pseudomonadota bacterium]